MSQPRATSFSWKRTTMKQAEVSQRSKKLFNRSSASQKQQNLLDSTHSKQQRKHLKILQQSASPEWLRLSKTSLLRTSPPRSHQRNRSLLWESVMQSLAQSSKQRLESRLFTTTPLWKWFEELEPIIARLLAVSLYSHNSHIYFDFLWYALLRIGLTDDDVKKAQLGLGHSFSRSKCATDVNRQDKPIT